jgi:hypothetical protein
LSCLDRPCSLKSCILYTFTTLIYIYSQHQSHTQLSTLPIHHPNQPNNTNLTMPSILRLSPVALRAPITRSIGASRTFCASASRAVGKESDLRTLRTRCHFLDYLIVQSTLLTLFPTRRQRGPPRRSREAEAAAAEGAEAGQGPVARGPCERQRERHQGRPWRPQGRAKVHRGPAEGDC